MVNGWPDLAFDAIGCYVGDRFYTRAQYEAMRSGRPVLELHGIPSALMMLDGPGFDWIYLGIPRTYERPPRAHSVSRADGHLGAVDA